MEDFDDVGVGATVGADAAHADEDFVAVHGLLGRVRIDEEITFEAFGFFVGHDEAEAIAVHAESAGDEIAGFGGGLVLEGTELEEEAFAREAAEGAFDFVAAHAFAAEFAEELFLVGAAVGQARDVREERFVLHLTIVE